MLNASTPDNAASAALGRGPGGIDGAAAIASAHLMPGLPGSTALRQSPARVLVIAADDSTAASWSSLLGAQSDMVCLDRLTDEAEGRARLLTEAVDVVVMGLPSPAHETFEAIAALRRRQPQALVVLLTDSLDAGTAQRAMSSGASGFLATSVAESERLAFLRRLLASGPWTPPQLADAGLRGPSRAPAPMPGGELTQREQDVLDAMARGLSNQAVAKELGITVPTVKFHVTNILGKLKVDNRTEAVLFALRHGLVDLG